MPKASLPKEPGTPESVHETQYQSGWSGLPQWGRHPIYSLPLRVTLLLHFNFELTILLRFDFKLLRIPCCLLMVRPFAPNRAGETWSVHAGGSSMGWLSQYRPA